MRIAFIGVPFNSAGLPGGEARAPAVLRAAGLIAALQRNHDVTDYGDVQFATPRPERDAPTGIIAPASLEAMVAAVRRDVGAALDNGQFPLVIGGECPLLLGCLAAARDAFSRIGLLFVDGHEDAWPPHRSTTGESADMELGLALGLTGVPGIPDLARFLPLVHPEDTLVLGPRDRDEIVAAAIPSVASVVTFRDDTALSNGGLATVDRSLLAQLQATAAHWWFHLDLDVLTTASFPAIRYPQPGGLSWPDVETIASAALATPGLVGWNITIYNPDLDRDGSSAIRLISFLETMLQDRA